MAGFEVRVREGEVRNLSVLSQRVTVAGDSGRIRAGDDPMKMAGLVAIRGVQSLVLPEMVALSPKLSIMKTEVTVGLFRQVMEGYKIVGRNAHLLKALIANPKAKKTALTYVNLLDSIEFAKRLSDQTGRKFRVQTEAEWLNARDQLSGSNWTWTDTKYSKNTYVLRHLVSDDHGGNNPGDRWNSNALRLVEDK